MNQMIFKVYKYVSELVDFFMLKKSYTKSLFAVLPKESPSLLYEVSFLFLMVGQECGKRTEVYVEKHDFLLFLSLQV